MQIQFPVYQHQTLTVLVDDSQSFLDSIVFRLQSQLETKVFHNPATAIQWIRQTYDRSAGGELPIHVDYDEQTLSFERRTVAVDIDQIYRRVLDSERFVFPSVLVIDYAMPQMDGLAFCQAIEDLPCKKILFTGQADEKIAIDAFNRGLIDRYIKKNDVDALEHLEKEITDLRKMYFTDLSRTLKDLLVRHSYAFLSDPVIGDLVQQLCNRYGFVEYYLFPNPTGILFFDVNGKPTLMVIETAAGLHSQFEAAQDNGAPFELLAALRELRLVPFFFDSGGMYAETIAQEWMSYCLPAQVSFANQNYYWALFDLPARFLPGPVYSYADFLRDQASGMTK